MPRWRHVIFAGLLLLWEEIDGLLGNAMATSLGMQHLGLLRQQIDGAEGSGLAWTVDDDPIIITSSRQTCTARKTRKTRRLLVAIALLGRLTDDGVRLLLDFSIFVWSCHVIRHQYIYTTWMDGME